MSAVVLATRSAGKAREAERILVAAGHEVASLADVGIEPDPAEDGLEVHDTFRANALAKARWFAARLGRPVIADDSGLRVDALGGEPGVRTKRFSGRDDLDGQALDDANNALLVERLAGLPAGQRGARYVCCAAFVVPDGPEVATVGTVRGRILDAPHGDGGFGYDPLFFVPGLDATFAQVPADTKNRISHRARAFRALAPLLKEALRT